MAKAWTGRFFEDFALGQRLDHPTPRTLGEGDAALHLALTGGRHAQHVSGPFARQLGLPRAPLDELLVFHTVLAKSVPDVSQNAIANLGYAECRFEDFVYPGETLIARSEVIGRKQTSKGDAGIVWVRTEGLTFEKRPVLDYVRWVMVRKRDPAGPAPEPVVPTLADHVPAERLLVPQVLRPRRFDRTLAGARAVFEDYEIGERIDHRDGMTVEEAEHRMATRLYQNTARVHLDAHEQRSGRFGRCIVFGGHVISIARALSFNGLEAVLRIAAINGGRHVSPCFAGDTVYAWSEVLDRVELRADLGVLRLRLVATRDRPCRDFPLRDDAGDYLPEVLLDLDYWAVLPRSAYA
jgi:2-methylfumaryl-CoA hydratase